MIVVARAAARTPVPWLALALIAVLAPSLAAAPAAPEIPHPDLAGLEAGVAAQLVDGRRALEETLADPAAGNAERAAAVGQLGRLYHAYGFTTAAAACYRRAEAAAPDDPTWPHLLGHAAADDNRPQEAERAYLRALALAPGDLALEVHLGELQLAAGRLDEAEAILRRALASHPGAPAPRAALGRLMLARERYGEAVELLTAALAAVPEANRLHYPLGLAYRGLGDREAARRHLAQRGAVGLSPPDPLLDALQQLKTGERVHIVLGKTAYRAGRFEEAAEAFRQALAVNPESAVAHVDMAATLGQLGDRRGAIEHLRRALELAPDSVTARFNLGSLLAAEGAHAEAAEHLRRVVAVQPDDSQARSALARSLAATGDPESALEVLTEGIGRAPSAAELRIAEIEILSDLGRYDEALERVVAARRGMPLDGRLAHAEARLLAACPDPALRDGERALELALQVVEASPSTTHAATVAMALAELGRCTEAAGWQQRVVAALRRGGATDRLAAAGEVLARYRAGAPCRPPA